MSIRRRLGNEHRRARPAAEPVGLADVGRGGAETGKCVIVEGEGEELSLVEAVVRENLHPADQFEAFKRLADEASTLQCGFPSGRSIFHAIFRL
jgi:ParB-like chromosome segregation protein Spo0J